MTRRIPILMYHEVTPDPPAAFRKYAVGARAFAAQMRWLALAGYRSVRLDTLLEHGTSREGLPPRPVVITFDDGFQACADHAVPVLAARGFTAVFHVVTSLVGSTSRWLRPIVRLELPMMDWPTIRRLHDMGYQIGSHSASHPDLAILSPAACRAELSDSRRCLEDHLGQPVSHLAYPFGSRNETVRALAAESGYRSACSTRIGFFEPGGDLLDLPRVPVSGHESMLDFFCRLRTTRALGESVRRMATAAWPRVGPEDRP